MVMIAFPLAMNTAQARGRALSGAVAVVCMMRQNNSRGLNSNCRPPAPQAWVQDSYLKFSKGSGGGAAGAATAHQEAFPLSVLRPKPGGGVVSAGRLLLGGDGGSGGGPSARRYEPLGAEDDDGFVAPASPTAAGGRRHPRNGGVVGAGGRSSWGDEAPAETL